MGDLFGAQSISAADDWPSDYEQQFRRAYPNKVGMAKAVKKLEMLRKKGENWESIIDGVRRYSEWLQAPCWRPAPKMATTFVNQECWKDEYLENTNGQRTASQRAFDLAREAHLRERR